MGYSGTGQANQLTFYEKNRTLNPDLVILLFVGNDFANNSAILESVRNGWAPDHYPRLFLKKESDGSCTRLPIRGDWSKFTVPGGSPGERVKQLRAMSPEYDKAFGSFEPEKDDVDAIFFRMDKLPPVFEEAVELTRCSLLEWKAHSGADRFSLIIVAAENVTAGGFVDHPNSRGQITRLRDLAQELDIPLLDLFPEFVRRGSIADARWKFDSHWSATGQSWAAAAITDYLEKNAYIQKNAQRCLHERTNCK